MKLLFKVHIIYYLCLFLFTFLIPNPSKDAGIFKIILLFLSLGLMFALTLFFSLIAFDKKYLAEKNYGYFILGAIFIELNVFFSLGHLTFVKMENMYLLYTILAILFISTTAVVLKLNKLLIHKNFKPWEEAKMIANFGDSLKGTPILDSVTKIDRMYIVFCVSLGIAERFYIFGAVVGIILVLSIKYLLVLKQEFIKSKLVTIKETYFSIIFYYFSYLLSIVWGYFIPNFTIILVGGAGILFIKLYTHRIAVKAYEGKNDLPDNKSIYPEYK